MTEAIKITTFLNMIFILLLAVSGSIGGALGSVVYYCIAFTLPVAVGFYSSLKLKLKREEVAGVAEAPDGLLTLDVYGVKRMMPIVAPAVAIVFAVSLLTSLVLDWLGADSVSVANEGVVKMLLIHALAPAILEEALFRYIPMKLLAPYSKRVCILYSSLCFALIHCSFFQMPYAFIAGMVFMTVDVALGSVWPSVILHFVNNTASIIWMKYCGVPTASRIFVAVLAVLTLISLALVYVNRKEYLRLIHEAMSKGDRAEYSYAPLLLAVTCVYVAIVNL